MMIDLSRYLILCGLALSFKLTAHGADPFPFEPPKNFSLYIEQGRIFHPVSTSNKEAQQFFDQGLTLVYGFNHDAAYWSFKKAAELDSNLAMAYWGMALALGQNINMDITHTRSQKAYALVQKALNLSKNATPNEQAYIQALSTRYSDSPQADKAKLAKNYFFAMEKVKNQFPDDLDAAALFAESGLDLNPWKQWDNDGIPEEGTLAIVAVLESVLKRDPDHLGANHYFIHAIEASNYPERALMSAERLRHLLPQSGHILHMPAHIYLLIGDYHLAALCNEQAVAADRDYIRRYGIYGIYPLHYMSHNLYFLSRAYSMEGRYEDALRAGNELYQFYAPHFDYMPELEYYISTSLFVMLRFHRWEEVLKLPAPKTQLKTIHALWHYARAMSFASLEQKQQSLAEQTLFLNEKEQIPQDLMYGSNKASVILTLADLTLKAKMNEQEGQLAQAANNLAEAVSIQDQLNYNEPPDWYFPIRESLGALLLKENRFQEAEKIFRQDLVHHPRNGRALFGLWISLKEQNRLTDAFWIQREFEKAWRYSTTPISLKDL